ncbi:MAG: OPT family oligopeptide transporter [Planctomycetota bacterium]|nr:MAG: OPT family oligopeptide transporter [Planctomycetota bacterium]
MSSSEASGGFGDTVGVKPEGVREFTLRSVLVGLVVAVLIAASYPYVTLKLGFGPNISVVSAFFGYLALGLVAKTFNRWENNMVETAGTAAGQTAFLCALMAAFDLIARDPSMGFALHLTPWQSFAWLTTAGTLGVLLAVPMRQHFVVDEKLAYPDGMAAAETLILLDSKGPQARKSALSMVVALALSAVGMLAQQKKWLTELWAFGASGPKYVVGMSTSMLSLGSGMLLGLRVNVWMVTGGVLAWVIAPPLLVENEVLAAEHTRGQVLLWVMWPATGMLVAGGLAALVLKWRILTRSFKSLSGAGAKAGDFPIRWVAIGSFVCIVALVIVQRMMFDLPIWQTLVAVALSIPMMLVGLRVLGETNWGPISALSNLMQGVFAGIAPGNVQANVIASGVTGSIAAESEGLMQDYRAGHILGTTPKYLTYMQLMAIPVGALTLSYVYPMLRDQYGIGGEGGLNAPMAQKWVGFAKIVSEGIDALPDGAFQFMAVGAVLGVIFTLLEQRPKWKTYVPSPTGLGIGMLVPFSAVFTMFIGGCVDFAWRKLWPTSAQKYLIPVASGLIAGEALVAVVLPLLIKFGLWTVAP